MDPVIPQALMSDNEYHVSEEQAEVIAQEVAYYNNRFRYSVIWFPGDRSLYEMTYPFVRTSNATLGHFLGRLPIELLYMILENIDIKSLLKFRRTNLRAREVVGATPHGRYQRVFQNANTLLRALFQAKIAHKFSLIDIDTALCTVGCAICGEFSGFISIPVWKRCCYSCLQRAPELRMQSLREAVKDFDLTKSQVGQLGSFPALPGEYTLDRKGHRGSKHIIVSTHQASMISGRPAEPLPSWKQYIKDNYMASCVLPFYDRRHENHIVESGLSCLGCYYARSQRSEVPDVDQTAEKLYTRDGFLRHFRICEQAQRLWETMEAGEVLPMVVQLTKHGRVEGT